MYPRIPSIGPMGYRKKEMGNRKQKENCSYGSTIIKNTSTGKKRNRKKSNLPFPNLSIYTRESLNLTRINWAKVRSAYHSL